MREDAIPVQEERAVQLAVIFRLNVRDTEPQRDRIGRGPVLPVRMPCCLQRSQRLQAAAYSPNQVSNSEDASELPVETPR